VESDSEKDVDEDPETAPDEPDADAELTSDELMSTSVSEEELDVAEDADDVSEVAGEAAGLRAAEEPEPPVADRLRAVEVTSSGELIGIARQMLRSVITSNKLSAL